MSVQRTSSSTQDDNDAYNPLAAFRYLPVSPAVASFLRRLNVLLSSYAGVDRVMMIIQVLASSALLISTLTACV
jgi:hypothetical protein